MLFKLHASKDTFELNPDLKAIPEFSSLTDRQMRYVILSTDYKSPFRKLSPEDRKYQAAVTAGYKFEKGSTKLLDINARNVVAGKVGTIIAAINKYNAIQKDEDYETLQSVNMLISQIREFNNNPDKTILELEKCVNLVTGKLDKLIETKKKIEAILELRDEEQVDPSLGLEPSGDAEAALDEESLPFLSRYNDSTND